MVDGRRYSARSDFAEHRSQSCLHRLAKSIIAALGIIAASPVCFANTIVVTRCNDIPAGHGVKGESIRTAVGKAMDGDIVDMSGMVTCSTITLQSGEIAATAANLSIVGPTDHNITIDGAGAGRVFYHSGTGVLSLNNFTVANGHTSGGGGCIDSMGALSLYNMQVHDGSAVYGGCTSSASYTFLTGGTSISSCTASNSAGGVRSGGDTIVNASSVTGNVAGSEGGGIGAIGNIFSLSSSILDNSAGTRWGALYAGGHVSLNFSTVRGNHAADCGGIAFLGPYAMLTSSTVEANVALTGRGGGICAYTESGGSPRTLTITNSTVSGNSANTFGGGIAVFGFVTSSHAATHVVLSNSTVSGNNAGAGGGGIDIFSGDVQLRNSTVSFNTAPVGGGLYVRTTKVAPGYGQCNLNLYSSIVAKNSGSTVQPDLIQRQGCTQLYSSVDNLVGDSNYILGGWLSGDPLLAPLANHGGPVKTHALLTGSPAIDAGDNRDGLTYDARGFGFPRIVGAKADLGAYERQASDDEIFFSGFD